MTVPWILWPCTVALISYGLFVLFYASRSPWYRSAVGRSLMLSKAVIVALLAHVLVVLIFGDYPGRINVWGVLFSLAAVAGLSQLAMLLRLQRRQNGGEHPKRRASDHP